ncbi:UNVERIFIED_CONTAM: hypothetical protein PYX00_011231 [Menopon gallinae]|uniref:NADH-ubiquinone oxidoreductase chain 2 n=1 Tax=Menopon gallinae TaxID=328185 RepID=A0AAW2H715_9NEOP
MCMYAVNFDVLWLCIAGILIRFACLHEWSARSILTYSSINHMRWLVACAIFSKGLTFFYFVCYSYLAFLFCFFMDNRNAFILKKIYLLKDIRKWVNTIMLNFSGLPPFVGFYPKIVVIAYIVFYGFYIERFLFLFLSLVPLYYYMKIFSVSITGEPSYIKSFIIFFNEQRWIFFSNIIIALITLLILYSIS